VARHVDGQPDLVLGKLLDVGLHPAIVAIEEQAAAGSRAPAFTVFSGSAAPAASIAETRCGREDSNLQGPKPTGT
jgi:hypothetical protein